MKLTDRGHFRRRMGIHPTDGNSPSRERASRSLAILLAAAVSLGLTAISLAPTPVHAGSPPTLLGEQPWYALLPHQLTGSSDLAVNVSSGDLVVHARDFQITGTGLNLYLDSYYNSEDTSTGVFGTWRLSTGADVRLTIGSSVTFTGPSGFQAVFTPAGGGQYTSPPGVDATLQQSGVGACNGDAYTMTFQQSNEQYCFNSEGTFLKDADRNGDAITFSYTSGQMTSITDTQGRIVRVTYGSTGSIQRLTDSTGRFTAYAYTASNQLFTYTDANGKQTTYQYNSSGVLSKITDPLGNETTFTYSVDNRHIATITYVTNNTYGTGPTWQFTYNSNETTVTDPNGHKIQYSYDGSGRATSVIDADGNARSLTYTPNDNALSVTDGLSQVDTLSYDTNNNLTQIQAPASQSGQTPATYSLNYSAPGQTFLPSAMTDPQGGCQSFTYDAQGNVTNVYAGQASPCSGQNGGAHVCDAYQGDASGTCGATETVNCAARPGELCWEQDALGNRTSYSYDSNGNVTTVTPPAPLGVTDIVPDALSRSEKVTDGAGNVTSYSYDAMDRITQILVGGATTCTSSSTCTTYTYDADGNLTERVDNTGTTTFSYDALNRVTMETLPASGTACSGQSGITFTYDRADNLTSYCDAGGLITYTYDPANNLTGLAEPGGTCPGQGTGCTTFRYDADGRRTQSVFPWGATLTTSYDNAGNVTQAVGKNSSGVVLTSFSYTYNLGSNDTTLRQTMTEADPQGHATTTYSYDSFDRLTQAATSPGSTLNYSYDADGNRCSTTTSCNSSYSYNVADELTASPGVSSYSYDGNGNEVGNGAGASFSYNAKNQTTAITDNSTTLSPLTYADLGQTQRTQAGGTSQADGPNGVQITTVGTSRTYYTRDNEGNLIGERLPNGSDWYYLTDGMGSVVGVTSSAGNDAGDRYHYDPFGNMTLDTGTVPNPWGFAGGYLDTTGLYHFGDRYYDPSVGRWTQQDPVAGSITNPSTLNLYAYVSGDPVNQKDAGGTCNGWGILGGIDLLLEAGGAILLGATVAIIGAPTIVAIPLGVIIAIAGGGALGWASYIEFANSGCF